MKQIFDQPLQLLQQGIAAIFRFVQVIWSWSTDQITKVFLAPWDSWPLWKQIISIVLIVALIVVVLKAASQLWLAGIKVLRAFANLLVAFVMTLPAILAAGVIALAGLWLINNLSFSNWPTIASFIPDRDSEKLASPPTDSGQTSGETVGRSGSRTGDTPVRDKN